MKKLAIATLSIGLLDMTACEELENLCGITAEDLGFTEDYTNHLNAAIYIYYGKLVSGWIGWLTQ